ncbi:MAG TPA: hypothetical protein VFE59_19795 [Trebonia sp.]|nr:hypothetical protein [Trebonia sp.]
MHPDMASALASQHRHEMTGKAGHHARTTLAAQAGETAEACQTAHAAQVARGSRLQAAGPRGPRRGARRPHLPGALLPNYRVTWSRTALSTAAADGARRGRSWVIVISATRGL